MTEILALLQSIAPLVSKTTLRQMSRIIQAMLSMTGRITMRGLSRWADKGGSYRTIHRFYHSPLRWAQIQWTFFKELLWNSTAEHLLVGDEVVVDKAGQETFGLGRFFSSIHQRPVSALAFFAFSVVNVQERQSYPIQVTQIVKDKEPTQSTTKPEQTPKEKRSPGRPKGSKNKIGSAVVLNAELVRLQAMLQAVLRLLSGFLPIRYLVLDGHFGNYPSAEMTRQAQLHLISKLRSDAALFEPFTGKYQGLGRPAKYGGKVNARHMKKKYLKETSLADGLQTDIYQAILLNKEFQFPINVVIMLKTNLATRAQSHVILFSTDVELGFTKMVDFYGLRFQIEFNFRDAKQYWGLDDFMNVEQTAVTNAANLSFFMVNLSHLLLTKLRHSNADYSVLDLKAHYHGCRYAIETIKLLPQKPDAILLAAIFEQIARLGMIHPVFEPSAAS
jgi:putative transposase